MSTFAQLIALPTNSPEYKQDFERRFHNSILLIDKTPYYINGRIEDFTYSFNTIKENKSFDIRNKTLNVEVFMPEAGYYNTDHACFYLFYAPLRQYTRSFSTKIHGWATPFGKRAPINLYSAATHIINNLYENIDKLDGKESRALSKVFCLRCKNENEEFNALMYRNVAIGTVDIKTKTITLTYQILRQEVQDLLTRQGATQWNLK